MTIICIFAVLTKQSSSALQENPVYVYRDRTVDTCRVASNARFSSLVRTSLESLSTFTYFTQFWCMKTSELYHLIRNRDDMQIWTNLLKEPSPSSLTTCFMYRSTQVTFLIRKQRSAEK